MTRRIHLQLAAIVSNDGARCAAECPHRDGGYGHCTAFDRPLVMDLGHGAYDRCPTCIAAEQAAASVPSCEGARGLDASEALREARMNETQHEHEIDPIVVDLMVKVSGFESSLRLLGRSARALLERNAGGMASDADVWNEALRHLRYGVVATLLDYLPTIAGPWEVTDTRARAPARAVRIGWQGQPIAEVRKRGNAWSARVGDAFVEHAPDDTALSVFWPTYESAIAACDDRLIADGVKFKDGTP